MSDTSSKIQDLIDKGDSHRREAEESSYALFAAVNEARELLDDLGDDDDISELEQQIEDLEAEYMYNF